MTLREKRCLFSKLISELVMWANTQPGYEVAYDDLKARDGHKNNSLHYIGLAADLNLYIDAKWMSDSKDHKTLGDRWKSMHPLCRWGGDFKHPDGNHYSIEHEGRM